MGKRNSNRGSNHRRIGKPEPDAPGGDPQSKASLQLEALEPRILLSATWVGTDGDDTHDAGNQGDELYGMGGNDTLHGGTGGDLIDGGTGNDQLLGDQGADTLISGGGSDYMEGGVGGDTFRFTGAQNGDVVTVVGGNGPDTIDLSAFSNGQLQDNGSSIGVDLGGGQSFTINYSEIESILTHDGTYAPGGIPAGNQAPTATDGSVSFNEDSSGAITLAGSDPDGTPIDHYVIDALPSHGTLLLNGSAVQVGGSVSQADVAAGHLTFAPEANWNGDTTIGFHAHDGTALSSNAGAFAIHVDPVNDAPTATDGSVSFNEDSSGAITLAGSDPDGTPIDHYVIDALPSHGTLLLNGSAVQVGGSVSQADVAAGHLTFTPEANWNGDTTIGFHAHDGTALSSNAGTFAIHVDPVDDPPAVLGGGGGAPPSTVSTGPDPAPTIGAQAGSSDHAAGDPTSVDGSLDEPVDQEPTDYQDDGVQVVDVLPPAPDQPPPAADDVQPLPVTDDVQSTPGHSGDAPASDAGSGSGTVSALHPGTSSPANSGYVVDRSGDAGSPGVKWSPNENIAVLNPLQHLGDSVEYNIGHAAPEAMPHAPIASGNELKDSTDHFVPTAVIEMEAPRPVTLAVDLVGIEPGQTVTDVFHEIAGGTSSHRELPGGQSVETNAAPAASSGRLTEDGAFELPGVMRSETPSDAVAAAPQYAELLDAGAAGFFAKLWAAIRGIGPSQPTNQANSGTERVGQRR